MSTNTMTLYPRMSRKPPFSVDSPGYEQIEGETLPRRNPMVKDKLLSTLANDTVKTVFELLTRSSKKFGNARALGSRTLIKTHKETKKVKKMIDGKEEEVDKEWTYYELSDYKYMSFIEYEVLWREVGAGFRKLGLVKDDRVHIFAATSAHWLATAHGAVSQSMPIVTAYDTLGEEGLRVSLVATKAKVVFLDPHLLKNLINPLKEAKEIRFVIYNTDNEVKQVDIDSLRAAHNHLTIMSFEELRILGKSNPVDVVPPSPNDLCCIMYTSGSTGPPKGVLLKHKNIIATVAGVDAVAGPYVSTNDTLLTYLPLAHVFEFMFENASLYWGTVMGYGNPKTISSASTKNCNGDIAEFKPSILVGVPAIWETVRKGIVGKVNESGALIKNMFWASLALKSFLLDNGLPGSGVLDAIVFKKVRQATGGRLRLCLNGAAPIAKDTQRFISMVLAPVLGGYGLTETAAIGAICHPMEWTDNALGSIPACCDIKLVEFPEAGYYAKNNQGEIWIRGENVTDGYYEDEKQTAESITPDGWFKTGDIGVWDKNGHLKLIDRKKNLVKMRNGEYIALEKLESIYRSASVVGNICVYGQGEKTKPIAIIVPLEPALKKLAADNNIPGRGLEDLVLNQKVQRLVLKELQVAGRSGGLAGIEIIDSVVLVDEEWNPQNGMTTSAQKLNRKGILERYKRQIDSAYSKID